MTYCVAIDLDEGLVFCSDSRTNAGNDQVATYSKMHVFGRDGERQFVLLSAGNLATTQAVVSKVQRDIEDGAEGNLFSLSHLDEAAGYVGRINHEELQKHSDAGGQSGFTPDATFIVGGQIADEAPAIYLVYPQGNFITTSDATLFLQIGENKYGKPILDRVVRRNTPLDEAAKCALVSMDSTMQSNVTVGPPIELLVLERDELSIAKRLKLDAESDYLTDLRNGWRDRITEAFRALPDVNWNAQT